MNNFFWCFGGMQTTLITLKFFGALGWPWIGVLLPALALSLGFIMALLILVGGFMVYDFIMRFIKK